MFPLAARSSASRLMQPLQARLCRPRARWDQGPCSKSGKWQDDDSRVLNRPWSVTAPVTVPRPCRTRGGSCEQASWGQVLRARGRGRAWAALPARRPPGPSSGACCCFPWSSSAVVAPLQTGSLLCHLPWACGAGSAAFQGYREARGVSGRWGRKAPEKGLIRASREGG